ncbi:hypothetical protein BDR05DRAFT_868081, partial [Suillus weaverae]
IEKDSFIIHQGLIFQSAQRLPHSSILYKLNSAASATWLSIPANQARFATNLRSNTTIKDRSYHILIKNIPMSYNPSLLHANSIIKSNGRLQSGTITKEKWIKPIARHKPNQRTAHTIITLKTREGANQIL